MIRKLLEFITRKPHYVYRSAITGCFVSREFALLNPREVVRERVK